MNTSQEGPSPDWEITDRASACRIVDGRLVLDAELELCEGDGVYTYIHCSTLDDKMAFRVASFSLLDSIEERPISPIFGVPLPPYRRLLDESDCREVYKDLEAGSGSVYYPYFQQLELMINQLMAAADTADDDDEEVDTWDRPDMTGHGLSD